LGGSTAISANWRYGQRAALYISNCTKTPKNGRVKPIFLGTKWNGRFTGASLPTNDITLFCKKPFFGKTSKQKIKKLL